MSDSSPHTRCADCGRLVPDAETAQCAEAARAVAELNAQAYARTGRQRLCYTHSYGCQQNVADGERLNGMLAEMGFGFTDCLDEADLILFNTCAVREHAENRVYGNLGALVHYKRRKPGLIVGVCGCMPQQETAAARIKKSFPFVDLVFGTQVLHRLPILLYTHMTEHIRVFDLSEPSVVAEGLPVRRDGTLKAWVPIMYGCDNFCAYCIVPYVRGRERSRSAGTVLDEVRALTAQGYKEITLLGQNVNSYGKGGELDFTGLLYAVNALEGDFRVRFMTSHPKDATPRLFDAIAACDKVCNHVHLPVQSGSDRVLREMNRRYTAEQYLALIDYARRVMPDVTFTSDILVGFPGETREDFEQTLALVRRVRYDALFTFLYSKRPGTAAADLPDPVSAEEKGRWFRELLAVQNDIGEAIYRGYVGRTLRVLFDGPGKTPGTVAGRTEGNTIVEAAGGPEWIGRFAWVRIDRAMNWAVEGQIIV